MMGNLVGCFKAIATLYLYLSSYGCSINSLNVILGCFISIYLTLSQSEQPNISFIDVTLSFI